MAQKKFNWTDQQSRAISEHGRNVLVSASAGTGKTAVLSGSCVDIVTNPSACPDVFSVLVVTFTDMAAEQMRSRIAQQLNSAIESTTDSNISRHLRHQLLLLGAADISTIHAFCKRLISENFYQLDLDPAFAILDADEAKLLKAETLEKTIDWAWEQPNIAEPLQQLLRKRNLQSDMGFLNVIININDFLDGVVSRDDWLERAKIIAGQANPFATDLAQSQRQIITETLQDALSRLQFALKIYTTQNPSGDWAKKCKQEYIRPVQKCLDLFANGRWEFEKPGRISKPDDGSNADFIADIVRGALGDVRGLKNLAILNPEYLCKFTDAVTRQTMVIIELLRQFGRFYSQAKKTINCLDFADLEHHALRLLADEKLEPTQTALDLRKKYKYVFVDECQDINGVQQAILDMLSPAGGVFAVGDPKQSIYQWRGARPEIFLQRLNQATTEPKAGQLPLRVDLNYNFRSVKPILDFVNMVFSRIMTVSFANINYDEAAHLRPLSADAGEAQFPVVELHLLDKGEFDSGSNNQQLQAAMIAQRIKQMVEGSKIQIPDKQTGNLRDIEYSDIVILMRKLSGKGDFLEALRLCGIPVSCEATAGYFEATEITDMLCLLKILDNPRLDIELAATLRSPFFRISDTELAKIRLSGKTGDEKCAFYDCVVACSQSKDNPDLAEKLSKALDTLDQWRTGARRGRIAELIWHVYRQSGLLSFVTALPDGPARRANLLKLHDRAIQFESFASNTGVPSLTRFIEFIEKLLAAGQDWSPAEPESAAGNAVRVLSVHKSKGLEFPVVFIADLDTTFSNSDSKRDCLFDEQSTLGLRIIDPDANSRFDSLAFQVIKRDARRKDLAEEMNILYVAMTRAINRLVLVGSCEKSHCQEMLTAGFYFKDAPVPDWYLSRCKSHLDWLLSALSSNLIMEHERLAVRREASLAGAGTATFDARFYDHPEIEKLAALIQNPQLKTKHSELNTERSDGPVSETKRNDFEKIRRALDWQYKFGGAPQLPAKRSVSQFTHRNDEFTKLDYSSSLTKRPKVLLTEEQFDGKNIGTATHLVLSQLDLDKPVTKEAITILIDKFVTIGAIAQPVATRIDVDSILKFFHSDLGRITLDRKNQVFREWPFTFALPASQWNEKFEETQNSKLKTQDFIIIQGIIDLLIRTPAGLIVVDFKTDNVSAGEIPARAELYRRQLELYSQAAEAITGKKVLSKWLYFLKPSLPHLIGCTR